MKKLLLLLIISIGLVSIYFNYGPSDEKAIDTALAEEEQAAILDAELAKFEAELVTKLALQKEEVEMERQAALDAFQQKLAADKAAAAKSTAAYQSKRVNDARVAALMADLASQEMMVEIKSEMARQIALDSFLKKLADDKASAAASTAAYQATLASDGVDLFLKKLIEIFIR
jgi:hypothetical protein